LARRAATEKQKRPDDERQGGARKGHKPVINRGATAPSIVDTDVISHCEPVTRTCSLDRRFDQKSTPAR
jgi:hypothetical protein